MGGRGLPAWLPGWGAGHRRTGPGPIVAVVMALAAWLAPVAVAAQTEGNAARAGADGAAPAAVPAAQAPVSKARSWNLPAERPARFEAEAVDVLCVLTGDCPDDCGAGRRQMGLVRAGDGVLLLVAKNGQPVFSGAVEDLLPFCHRAVEVDGLLIEDPDIGARNIYQLQLIRPAGGDAPWEKATKWTRAWAERHAAQGRQAGGQGPWFRRDPMILEEIARHGYLGLGPEVDRAFIREFYR